MIHSAETVGATSTAPRSRALAATELEATGRRRFQGPATRPAPIAIVTSRDRVGS
jgi:hypothetical protein